MIVRLTALALANLLAQGFKKLMSVSNVLDVVVVIVIGEEPH